MGTKEAALTAGGFGSLLLAVGEIVKHYGWMNADEATLWIALLTIVGMMAASWWARSRVVSEATIQQTGQTLESVKRVADNPDLMLEVTGTGDGGKPPADA